MFFFDLLLPCLLYLFAATLVQLVFPALSALASTGLGALISLPFLFAFYRREMRSFSWEMFPTRNRRVLFLLCPLLGICACVCVNALILLSGISSLFPGFQETTAELLYAPPLAVQIAATGILIPAAEELVFRGGIYLVLRRKLAAFPAMILCSLLFALYHGNVVQGIYAFLLGFLAVWLLNRTQSILYPVLFHMAANLASLALNALLLPLGNGMLLLSLSFDVLLFGALLLFLIHRIAQLTAISQTPPTR